MARITSDLRRFSVHKLKWPESPRICAAFLCATKKMARITSGVLDQVEFRRELTAETFIHGKSPSMEKVARITPDLAPFFFFCVHVNDYTPNMKKSGPNRPGSCAAFFFSIYTHS